MHHQFEIFKTTRQNVLKAIEGLSLEQLNQIPDNFNNNIIWNVAHILVTQQLLVYGRSGVPFTISSELIEKYRKGTKATNNVSAEEVEEIKSLMISTVPTTIEDYSNGKFDQYNQYPTSYNVVLNTADEAISFNNVHAGLHLGYIMALKRIIH